MKLALAFVAITSVLIVYPPAEAQHQSEPASNVNAPKGFKVERLCLVPREQGSWVSMTFDPQGRIIVSDQSGPFYRVEPAPIDRPDASTRIEKLTIPIGGAQGLLYAHDSLFAVASQPETGVFRVPDRGEGDYGKPELVMKVVGKNEHGPHGIVADPDGKWMYVVAGNHTPLPEGLTRFRVAEMRGTDRFPQPAHQGWVVRLDPAGERRELVSMGLRNSYDLAVSPDGEIFTFDSDNEGYMGLPWYRPTNVFHIVSGSDFGWRQGPDTLPSYAPDNPPPVVEVGPGSPTGMIFGAGAKFPAKYQRALFACDWSYGRIYAIHLKAKGGGWTGSAEVFLSGRPLPAADIEVGPDGALYFVTGGRGIQSALYRVTWDGDSQPGDLTARGPTQQRIARALRQEVATFHGERNEDAVDLAWPMLKSTDRSTRYAARVAIESQPPEQWFARAFAEIHATARLEAMIAVARQAERDMRSRLVTHLSALNWDAHTTEQNLALLRAYTILFQRMGAPEGDDARAVLRQLDARFPHNDGNINRELAPLMFDLSAENLLDRTIVCLQETSSVMRQIHFLRLLRRLDAASWGDEQKKRLWDSLALAELRDTAARPYSEVQEMMRNTLASIGVELDDESDLAPQKVINEWTVSDLLTQATAESLADRDVQGGRAAFRRAQCHTCHRVGTTGGVLGPNLTGLAGRYTPEKVLESIIDPSKVVADPYRTTIFLLQDGRQITGQIVDLKGGNLTVRTDPLRPFARVTILPDDVEETRPSKVSLMPQGLVNHLTEDEILDMLAYLLQRRS